LSRVSALTSGPTSTVFGAVADLQRAIRAENFSVKASARLLVDVDAVGGGAGLAEIAHLGQHRAFDGGVHVGILQNTSTGALPPSSIAGFSTWSAADFSSLRPTPVEPVKLTTRTRGSCSM
jgi:hypothetical protein